MSMTTDEQMWNDDRKVREDHKVPPWIEQDIQYDQVMAIVQGGCSSGSYMPAVTYHIASSVMGEQNHGNAVLEYLDSYGITDEIPLYRTGDSWQGIAVRALSLAVETWANTIHAAYDNVYDKTKGEQTAGTI